MRPACLSRPGEASHPQLPLALSLAGIPGIAGVAGRWRKVVALSLALVFGLFGVESAVHSFHHLWDPRGAAQCQVHLASQHVPAAPTGTLDVCAPILTAEASLSVSLERNLPSRFFGPEQGRAPPSLLA